MAVLQKMRDKFGIAISVIIALSLLYFIAPMSDLMTLFGSPQNIGDIAGKKVSYEDFQADVERYTTINQILTGSSVQNEQTQRQICDAAWQELIDKYLFVKNAKAAGINVGTDELVDLTTGENVSPFIAGNPMFAGNDGVYDPAVLVDFVQNLDSDQSGSWRTYWNFIQNSVLTQTYYAKYMALFAASNIQNNLIQEYQLPRYNTNVDVDYVRVSYPFAKDSTITVSKSEIKEYYNSHKKDYKREESRDIEYVSYEVVPSSEDIAAVRDEFEKNYDEFKTTENLKAFILKNSEQSFKDYWYKKDELCSLNADINDFVNGTTTGTSEIVNSGNSFYAARIIATAQIPDSAYVKHILLQGADSKTKADSLAGLVAKGADFSQLVEQYSADKGSATDGVKGNIGWMTQNYMIPGFESVFTMPVGKPVVLSTQYGQHVVVVVRKSAPVLKKQVAIFEKTAIASKETFNDYYTKANTVASMAAGTYDGFLAAVDSLGLFARSQSIIEGSGNIGNVKDAKEVSRWVYEHKAGKASQIITVNNKYFFVVAVKDIKKAGIPSVNELSSSIENYLYGQKLQEKFAEEVMTRIAGLTDINEVATILNSKVESLKESPVAQREAMVEPALAGAMAVAEDNVISGPVKGTTAVYVFVTTNRKNDGLTGVSELEKTAAQKDQYTSQFIVPAMMESAGVKDNRNKFF